LRILPPLKMLRLRCSSYACSVHLQPLPARAPALPGRFAVVSARKHSAPMSAKKENVECRTLNVECRSLKRLAMTKHKRDKPSTFEIRSSTFDILFDRSANRRRISKQLLKIFSKSVLQNLIHYLAGQDYPLLFQAGLQSLGINFSEIAAAAYRLSRGSSSCLPKADTMVY
jgi:hypothetical protein